MRTALVLLALMAAGSTLAQQKSGEVWKWVDKEGITHYSDQPGPPGSVKVDLRIQTYTPTTPSVSSSQPLRPTPAPRYASLAIVSPAPETTFHETTVSIAASLQPGLRANHRVRFEIDGQPQGTEGTSLNVTAREVPRGAHVVRASVVDEGGAVLIQSDPVTFFVQLPSVLAPARNR